MHEQTRAQHQHQQHQQLLRHSPASTMMGMALTAEQTYLAVVHISVGLRRSGVEGGRRGRGWRGVGAIFTKEGMGEAGKQE